MAAAFTQAAPASPPGHTCLRRLRLQRSQTLATLPLWRAVPLRRQMRLCRAPQWRPPAAAAVPSDGLQPCSRAAEDSRPGRKAGWLAMLTPLSDPVANRKLLALCAAQMLASIGTLIHDTYLPLYMSEVLHMTNTKMGNLHALLQFMSRASGVVSGRLADVLSPARMVIVGTGITALVCKPMFAVSGLVHSMLGTDATVRWVIFAKVFDRTVKGIREAPSKALVGDLAHESGDSAAAAFSVRQALSTLGMLGGSAAAALAFQLSGRSYEVTMGMSVVPAVLALALLLVAFGGKAGAADFAPAAGAEEEEKAVQHLGLANKARALVWALPAAYWQALATVCILYMARFDVAFITVHASTVMDKASLPMLTFFSMAPVVVLAAPMGLRAKASVRARNFVLMLGIFVLLAGNLFFSFMPSVLGCILGSSCVGVHMAMTQGVMFGMLSSYIPNGSVRGFGRISGTAWSLTDLLLGVALAFSNTLAGRLTDVTAQRGMGSVGCFLGACAACAASILALLLFSAFGDLGKEELVVRPKML